MQTRWTDKNVDLALLSQYVEEFFNRNGFETRKTESTKEFTIFATHRRPREAHGDITVRIVGCPNDFAIEFLGVERARSSIILGYITTLIGGGGLLLRGLKSQEALERLEKRFWEYVEEIKTRLIGSVGSRV